MGLRYGVLLVFCKNFTSSACLLYEIQLFELSLYHIMPDFKKIRYRAVIEFLTLENIQPQQIHNRMIVVYGEDVPSYATV